jgi:hypothetical protein
MPDKQLKCVQCHQEFPFTEGEQRFYAERQYTEPKRCKPCRDAKKEEKARQQAGAQPPVPDEVVDQYRQEFNRKRRGRDRSRDE